jgi:hypothetical protein
MVFFLSYPLGEGTIAQISRSMCHCGLKLQADKETGARRGESVPAGGEGARAPGRARTAAHPRAQAQRRAPVSTPDLLVHPRESPAPSVFNPVSLSFGLHPLGDQTNTNTRSNISFKTISVYNVFECK